MFLISWPGGSWEATAKLAGTILAIYIIVMWMVLVFWTYRDIRQRTRDPIVQTVAVLLVLAFFLPGHWVYLILRPRQTLAEAYERSLEEEALLQELEDQKACPSCKRRVHDDFLVCPSCAAQLKEPCRSCSKPLSYAWVVCPYCGLSKSPRQRQQQRQQSPRPTPAPTPARSAAPVTELPSSGVPSYPRAASAGGPAPRREEGPLIDATRE
ncbi:hypothetical protein AYO38_00450 [bacterium SCGC AG-212-C10]|nr:hypothetical protein AYO38_00450 [bacterium SCGC AG-212-C10]